jgi:hypothetical protein
LSEEIITMLSNLGAIEESKAVDKQLLNNSQSLKDKPIDEAIVNLVNTGYVKESNGRLYLTQAGLFRALSRFS